MGTNTNNPNLPDDSIWFQQDGEPPHYVMFWNF